MTTIHIILKSGKSIELTPEEARQLQEQLEAIMPKRGLISIAIQKAKEREQREEFNRAINQRTNNYYPPTRSHSDCVHMSCTECHGTGIKANGSACVHMFSCSCIRCSPTCMSC